MPLYEMTPEAFRPISQASFADLKVRERDDLQRLLRTQIDVLGDDLYVLSEEFGDWDDSRRRIDLLAIDPQANLVVIELREKEQVGRKRRAERYDVRLKFWEGLVAIARNRHTRHANIKPGSYSWLGASSGIRGLGFNHVIVQEYGVTELYIDRGEAIENNRIFDQLHARKDEIEMAFGGMLSWERLDSKRACRIKHIIERGGYRSPEADWPAIQSEMVDSMTKLEAALKPALDALGL